MHVFQTNTARSGYGGGVWTTKSARIVDGLFQGNQVLANGNGGGLEASNSIWLTDTIFTDNRSWVWSGGGSSNGGDIHTLRGEYRRNQAADDGGGILSYGTATINATGFFSNTTGDLGGGVGVNYLVGRDNRFQGNTAGGGGGEYLPISASTSRALPCWATTRTNSGGGILAPQTTILETSFRENSAGGRGGGLMPNGGASSLDRLSFINNQAAAGGGIYCRNQAPGGTLVNTLLAGNTALGGSGAALYLSTSGAFTIRHATIAGPACLRFGHLPE